MNFALSDLGKIRKAFVFLGKGMARPERLELPTLWFEARCSIQLSYGRILGNSIIFTLLRSYVKLWHRRNFWSIWSNINRNIEPNAYYFRLVEPVAGELLFLQTQTLLHSITTRADCAGGRRS